MRREIKTMKKNPVKIVELKKHNIWKTYTKLGVIKLFL